MTCSSTATVARAVVPARARMATIASTTTTLDRRPIIRATNHDAAARTWNHHARMPVQTLASARMLSTTRVTSSAKDIAKLFVGAVLFRGLDAAEKYDRWRAKRRQKRDVEQQLGARLTNKQFEKLVERASKMDPNSPQAKRLAELAKEANGGVERESGMTIVKLPQVEVDALRFAPRYLEPTSKMSVDAKGFPVIRPEFFESIELDTDGLNPMTVRLKQQVTSRQPFQLFMVQHARSRGAHGAPVRCRAADRARH
ncbi:hypothetical protein AMAG_08281 [Allomyces macrogynus ATCC 38327]|uniref:Uncharacterized protein n=1 Tax=Allomyces macrogynus (strain ATCC 38327) TaxID=578462 RepID=A0A0L0SKN3_ALLM3|nr:hypothetical protein, variant [Allomyces macrogynus ATCC 38327]KNE63117.1 hypothetical protein AMAG_08281 [Allomyces macrogynus ATCC 38327]|eukprot:KNE63116.1 hypothetical protein, variant [Allomyces macrogynus ATCC 38327]